MRLHFIESRTFEGLTYEAGIYEVNGALATRLLERFPRICSVEEELAPSSKSRSGDKYMIKSKMESEGTEPESPRPMQYIAATYQARLLARHYNIDLAQIQGNGNGGKITVRDVREYLATAPITMGEG